MSDVARGRGRALLFSRPFFTTGAVAGAMLLAAVLATIGLDNHLFWDDEANTAIYARNLLKFGKLTAWDGRNLVGYSYGGALGEDLGRELRVPALPAYVAALGMLLCGETTFGGRIMFVVAGVAAVGLLAVWMRRFIGRRSSWYLPALILALSPAYLLFIRNCRYYALGVVLTLLVWTFWGAGPSRGPLPPGRWLDRRLLLRCLGGAAAVVLLLTTHYLNAVAALATLPLWFLDRRDRNPSQYVLLGVILAVTLAYGAWIWVAANPFSADYVPRDPYVDSGQEPEFWRHAAVNFWWFLRDLGTHEFVPWCLAPVLLLPWLPGLRSTRQLRRMRPLARRAAVLLAVVVVYVAVAALLTPLDMGTGPTAEMRYVVPLLPVGAALGGSAIVILWQLARPLAVVTFLLLVTTNTLHLGFLAKRLDRTDAWWPPTLYRYVAEVFHDYETGNEAMIALLRKLPPDTTVRIWPPYLVYPAMFYVPELCYCEQLTESKRIRPELRRELDEHPYLFYDLDRSRPQLLIVPLPYLRQKLGELLFIHGADSYRLKTTVAPFWDYTWKPELPGHFFSPPAVDWNRYPGLVVAAETESAVAYDTALLTDPTDADALCRLAIAFKFLGDSEVALNRLKEVLQIDPDHALAHYQLGVLLTEQRAFGRAVPHLQAALRLDPRNVAGYLYLGEALLQLGRPEQASRQYLAILRLQPGMAVAHYNLGNAAMRQRGGLDRAIYHYREALRSNPKYARARVNLGTALLQQGKIDEAISHYHKALQMWPQMVQAHVQLATALYARGDKPGAVAELQTALKYVPTDQRQQAEEIRKLLDKYGGP